MFETLKFIGKHVTTGGMYIDTLIEGLKERSDGDTMIYKFTTAFGVSYYITDPDMVRTIKYGLAELLRLTNHDQTALILLQEESLSTYLYRKVIELYGPMELVRSAEHEIEHQKQLSYDEGIDRAQRNIRTALGLK